MKIISWNVNGARNSMSDILSLLGKHKPDMLLLQEIKCTRDQLYSALGSAVNEYTVYVSESEKTGHHGVATLVRTRLVMKEDGTFNIGTLASKIDPVIEGSKEGRLICSVMGDTLILNTYSVNVRRDLSRADVRSNYDKVILNIVQQFIERGGVKHVMLLGDFNVVNESIDYHAGFLNNRQAGMTDEERNSFRRFLGLFDVQDVYRHLYPQGREYTYFSYIGTSRRDLKGWRIDYALVCKELMPKVVDCTMCYDYYSSDHIPIILDIDL